MIKLIKRLVALAILVGVVMLGWKVFRATEDRPPLTPQERAEQKDLQRKQAISIRLDELERTNGAGRQRQNADVENAARILYNTRNKANLPLVK